MTTKTIKVLEFNPREIELPTVNGVLLTIGDFVNQFFLEEPYVKVENEDAVYHSSQSDKLIERLKEITREK